MKIEISQHELESWIRKLEEGKHVDLYKDLEQLKRDAIIEKIDRKVRPIAPPIRPETTKIVRPEKPDTMRCPKPPYLKVWF